MATTTALLQAVNDQTDMFLKLARRVSSREAKDKNLIFSPLSLHVVLSLITAGSSGDTKDELLGLLQTDSTDVLHKISSEIVSLVMTDCRPCGGPELQFANGVWVDQTLTLKHSFKEVVDRIYKVTVDQVDFVHRPNKASSKVNWAKNQTNGLIKEILAPNSIDSRTKLILANALYFKGDWDQKFDASSTKQGDFHLTHGGSVKVPFMTTYKQQFISNYEDFKVLRLPYKKGKDTDRQFSMSIFLPHEKDGLLPLMKKLSSQPGFLNSHIPSRKVKVGEGLSFRDSRFRSGLKRLKLSRN